MFLLYILFWHGSYDTEENWIKKIDCKMMAVNCRAVIGLYLMMIFFRPIQYFICLP